jgi:short-subunit dehydrogenase
METAVTLITGASGGIGEKLAHLAAQAGRKLVLTARSAKGLKAVADAVAAKGHARPVVIALDLSEPGAADRIAADLKKHGLTVAELVNNAGYGLSGHVAKLPRADQINMLDLNVRALTDLTLHFLPQIIAAHGGILNVASTAGFLPGPGMAVYYASKAYVLWFSEALAWELRGRVRVTALCPGPTPTGFQERARGFRETRLAMFMPTLTAEQVAEQGWRGFERGRRIVIPGLMNKIGAIMGPRQPRGLTLALSAWLTGGGRATA